MADLAPFVVAFDACAAEHPGAVAVVSPEMTWSYSDLQRTSRELAAELVHAGCTRGDVVALSLGRSAWHVAAILAAWRIGAAFLPLDPLAPARRQRACMEEAQAWVLLRPGRGGEPAVEIESLTNDVRETRPDGAGGPSGELAYVLYTSGSTGAPKGVRVGHRGLVPMLRAQIEAFGVAPGKRVLFALSTAFDASISDLGTALLAGAALVLAPAALTAQDLVPFLRLHAITHADLPPSLLARVPATEAPASLETVIIGGEVCPLATVRSWARRVRLVNVYGPTEATICTSLVRCDADTWDRPRLGQPLPHVEYRVEDGELLIGGPALALGYVQRPELDAARFVLRDGRRFYRSGDRVRPGSEGEDGGLEFLGRVDRQVKLRGQLVSPEEIEVALLAFPEVQEAAVSVVAAVLTAHVVLAPAAPGDAHPDPQAQASSLRARLADTLPQWMLPNIVIEGLPLPRGTTGKVAVPDPRTAVIAAAFAEVLGATDVGADSDFVALGGDSLAAVEVAALAQAQGVIFEPAAVLDCRTPAAIARSPRDPGRTREALDAHVKERLARVELKDARDVDRAGGDLLVTGATGFLGRRLVLELLSRSDARLHCLVRARDDDHARARLAEAGLDSPKLVAHAGDASAPGLALSTARAAELRTCVGQVVHLAAAVNQVLSFEMLAAANVTAAIEVARFARESGAFLTHVSTLAVLAASDVAGHVAGGTLDERTELTPSTRLFGGYAQSKYVAEEVARRIAPRHQVVRPGLLTGDSVTGVAAASCPLATFLRALAQLGCVPRELDAAPRVDVTPVDHAARVLAALVLRPADHRLVHLSSAGGASLADLVRAVRTRVDLAEVDAGTFVERVRRRLSRESALAVAAASYRLLGREVARDADLFLLTGRVFDGALAERLTGLSCPPADDALLRRYVDRALGSS